MRFWHTFEVAYQKVVQALACGLGIDLDDAAYIPTARALELYNRDGMMKIDLSYEEGIAAARISESIIATLKARHGREDFTITTQEDMLRTLSNILDVLTMAVGALGKGAPYRECLTHGWTVDGEGRAMHKSLGNGMDPAEIINEFGADMLRLWAGSADYHADMRCSKEIFKQLTQN